MVEIKMDMPKVPDIQWVDKQYPFDGEWMPDVDPALIGARNFASIINLRYNDRSVEGVNGYTRINETYVIDAGSTVGASGGYIKINNGFQLRTDRSTNSYILVQAQDSSGNGRVYINTGTINTASEFNDTVDLDINGNPYFADSEANLQGRFSKAPQNSVVYCNSKSSNIYSGSEHRMAAVFQTVGVGTYGIVDKTDAMNRTTTTDELLFTANLVTNGTMEANSNWTDVGTPSASGRITTYAHSSTYSWYFTADAANEGIISDNCTISAETNYEVSLWVYPVDATAVTVTIIDDVGSLDDTSHTTIANQWNNITVSVTTNVAASTLTVQIDSGADAACTIYVDDVSVCERNKYDSLILMTTRPVQGFKFYVDPTDVNGVAADLEVEYWAGTKWAAVSSLVYTDTEAVATKALSGSGNITFTHTNTTVKLKHLEELYLYAYRVKFNGGSGAECTLYSITCDPAFQPVQNVWDGVYRQPIQFQVYDHTDAAFQDYTLHVNQSSDLAAPVGADFSAIGTDASNDLAYIMFEEQVTGIRMILLGNLYNKADVDMTVSYWNGITWTAVSNFDDDTQVGNNTLAQSGLISWTAPSDEEAQTKFGSYGYMYKLTFDGAITGAAGSQSVIVDLCLAVPALTEPVKPFTFSALYQNRLMLGGYTVGSEGNRMDFSVSNAPDVFNGFESSADGVQSLYFGGVEDITCATQLYNRFGASIFSMLLVMKDTEVFLLVGESPEDYTIYPVAETVGCPAPMTLAVAEVGFEVGEGLTRNVAIWLSHYGPMMFDGAILSPIKGISNYFDPNENEYIEWDYVKNARGWVDQTYKEYNLLIPSGSGQETTNLWLVYDLLRKKWFRKDTGGAAFPQCAWNVMDPDTGEQRVYGGIDTGYMIQIENGTSWNATFGTGTDGTGIEQRLKTGDFFPSENIWDLILIRKFKLICKKLPTSSTATILDINYYADSADSGANVIFQDSDSSLGVNVDFQDMDANSDGTNETEWTSSASGTINLSLSVGLDRVVRLIQDMNNLGWAHSFEFVVTTTAADKGWQPIVWGIQYRVERKDNKAVG